MVDDRPRQVLLQLLVDFPDHPLSCLRVGLAGLPVEKRLQIPVAVVGVVALGPAGEVYLTGSTSSADFPTAHSIQPYISSNFFYTADRGASWTPSSPTGGVTATPFLTPTVAADPKTPSRVYALADRLYVSNDRGQNWTPLGTPAVTQPQPFFGPFGSVLVLDPLTPSTIYAGGVCQFLSNSQTCGISKSTDGGATWTLKSIGVSSNGPPNFASGLAIMPLARLIGHPGPVLSAVFSPDGHRVLTASSDMSAMSGIIATYR